MLLIFHANDFLSKLKIQYKNPSEALRIITAYYLYREFHLDCGIYELPIVYRDHYSYYHQSFFVELRDVGEAVVYKSQYYGEVSIVKSDLRITINPTRNFSHVV